MQDHFAGGVLREAVVKKYGKSYDLSIVRRQIPGGTEAPQASLRHDETLFSWDELLDGMACI